MSHATSSKNQVKDVKSEAPQTEQPSWTSTFSNINPWANSRGQAPLAPGQPAENADEKGTGTKETSINQDHLSMPIYGKSFRNYPSDCPPLRVRWFHAVDAPKWTPHSETSGGRNEKKSKANTAKPKPKKFSALSKDDSKRVEKKYQQLLEAVEDQRSPDSRESRKHGEDSKMARVPVNEDFLFEVNIEKRELAPVYWAGPIYETRRGIWFFQEGSKLRPCDENLATQVEEGYLKARPWRQIRTGDNGNEETDNASMAPQEKLSDTVSQASIEPSQSSVGKDVKAEETSKKLPPPSQRLFGAYMNSFITYEDASTAWLTSDSMLSWVTTSVYERFGGGGYMSGVKLIRGYSEQKKTKAKEPSTAVEESDRKAREELTENARLDQSQENSDTENEQKPPQLRLERRLSSFIANESRSEQRLEEDVQKFNEEEIRHDYLTADGESQTREIKHLILVTHGIGQRLSLRMESVNFIHDVNVMRKTLKAVYANSNQLRSVNAESQDGPGNCQVQVLPVCWRNMVDFPKRRNKPHESDLTDAGHEDDEYPSLEDITVEGVSFARSLMSDLALDVLLYQSSYRAEIAKIVIKESNRIVKLFRERNPGFQGQVHVMGHSLGSAILFDILCQQQRRQISNIQNPLRFLPSRDNESYDIDNGSSFRFDVEDFYCIGSPVGLFQMLNGRTIAGRESLHLNQENPVKSSMPGGYHENGEKADLGSLLDSVSSPEVSQLFNIFHPSDPISYRLEPLIVPQMAELKPKPLPYTKKGIFGSVPGTQGLTDISARVGQSVSGLWSSLSMGITANLLPASMRATPGDTLEQVTEELQSGGGASAAGLSSQTELDNDLESLYSVFQKREDKPAGVSTNEADPEAVKWRRGRERLLALNRSGRVDFNIQESALDFNPINTIASHIGYWADEDVSHFILSQLLSRRAKKAGKVDSKK